MRSLAHAIDGDHPRALHRRGPDRQRDVISVTGNRLRARSYSMKTTHVRNIENGLHRVRLQQPAYLEAPLSNLLYAPLSPATPL
jgi:hypothetical protein